MILSITTTHYPATDLGFVLHKHPDKFQSIDLTIGKAHIFYPESNKQITTVCLLLDIDPIDMVKNAKSRNGHEFSLGHYINDRPYVASSFMSVAIAKAFSSALNGKCKDKPELVETPFPLQVELAVVAAPQGGEILIRKLFEPLGYEIQLEKHILNETFPNWGDSKYFTLRLKHTLTIKDLLAHLYVLIPVLDNDKHYFVSYDEIEKLLQRGGTWLKEHPEKKQITKRYLANMNALSRKALHRLQEEEGETDPADLEIDPTQLPTEQQIRKQTLHDLRLQTVAQKLADLGAKTVLDLGCGEGKLLRLLLKNGQFTKIVGTDVAYQSLLRAKERLYYDEMAPRQKERIEIFQSSLMYKDKRFMGFDAVAVVEVIEHVELNRLSAFEQILFDVARPKFVIITTPNQEYNVVWEQLSAGTMRHDDHRFEWTRAEFSDWATKICEKYGYSATILPIGEAVENIGSPSQMVVFSYGN